MNALDPDAVVGCLLGQAVGDMMGLPAENLSPRRLARLFPTLDRPAFVFGYGMGSDDTEHACMTTQALLRSGGDLDRFRRSLAWRLRWWFLGLPAGIGRATLKACVKLWVGFPSTHSGVYSAGNGTAMRAAILGVALGHEPEKLKSFVRASTRITHTDPKAEAGAFVVAWMAHLAATRRILPTTDSYELSLLVMEMRRQMPDEWFSEHLFAPLSGLTISLPTNDSTESFATEQGLGRGVTGYINHTVTVALFAFFRHPDNYRAAVESVIRCGGDTDTVAAITGALVGARVGKAGIPAEWLSRFADWPRSAGWIERLGRELAAGKWRTEPQPAVPLAWWALPVRNLVFFLVVLGHVFRRLLPPY